MLYCECLAIGRSTSAYYSTAIPLRRPCSRRWTRRPVDVLPERQDWSPTLGGAFTEPVLEEFDDLKDLLLLDPVHDVAEAGWPVRMDDQSET